MITAPPRKQAPIENLWGGSSPRERPRTPLDGFRRLGVQS